MQATTKQVRDIVRALCNVYSTSWTDKSTRGDNVRNVTFVLREFNYGAIAKVNNALAGAGFVNRVKITTGGLMGGESYLRINNCVLK